MTPWELEHERDELEREKRSKEPEQKAPVGDKAGIVPGGDSSSEKPPQDPRASPEHAALFVVRQYLERAERSPGLTSGPFSAEGWRVIERALVSATGRSAVIEECAKVCDEEYRHYSGAVAGAYADAAARIRALDRRKA